ncbi:MAG: DUF3347 domain-containing protein [Balneolales bacterium]|nr:DUF3347 domain-containing protein [Balneolales bacterium]
MKLSMKHSTLFLAAATLLFSCGGSDHSHEQHTAAEPGAAEIRATGSEFEVPDSFVQSLESALDGYFLLSAAFADTDAESVMEQNVQFSNSISETDTSELEAEATEAFADFRAIILSQSESISQETDIEQMRYHFEYMSDAVIAMVDSFGPLSYTVYVQRCPMVRDGSADWLSAERQITNPYHGNRMLRCGTVVREM